MGAEHTKYQDTATVFSQMVRLGIVMAADNKKRLVKVKFPDLLDDKGQPLISEWIPVLINRDFIPDYTTNLQRTEYEPCHVSHKHDLIIRPYMPMVNHQVLCLYEPVRNGRGYCLGGIRPWKNPGPPPII